eukprot:TRINITY_DN23708_c0_g1_i1.p1 TRINITY_DN23708_c0_g1~~TRINITY_DN23708_c0_g1_i1.p1  ORF type:complete len:972 (+),score=166.95 TRINITY_DN23708_c0_g1_i1:32-2917(+)
MAANRAKTTPQACASHIENDFGWIWEDRAAESVPRGPNFWKRKISIARTRVPRKHESLQATGGEPVKQCVAGRQEDKPVPPQKKTLRKKVKLSPSQFAAETRSKFKVSPFLTESGSSSFSKSSVNTCVDGGSPKLGTFTRLPSRLTLAHAAVDPLVPGSEKLWRGQGLLRFKEHLDSQAFELASHRDDRRRQYMAQGREKAARWQQCRHDALLDQYLRYIGVGHTVSGESDSCVSDGGPLLSEELDRSSQLSVGLPSARHGRQSLQGSDSRRFSTSSSGVAFFDSSPLKVGCAQEHASFDGSDPGSLEQAMFGILAEEPSTFMAKIARRSNTCCRLDATAEETDAEATDVDGLSLGDNKDISKATERLSSNVPPLESVIRKKQKCLVISDGDCSASSTSSGAETQGQEPSGACTRRSTSSTGKSMKTISTYSKSSSSNSKGNKVRRLLEARRSKFAEKPATQQNRLRRAFSVGDRSNSACLDARGAKIALEQLGLGGRTPEENHAIFVVIRESLLICGHINFIDFVFQLVPEVETKLQEMRSPVLYQEFQSLDFGGVGRVGEDACLKALERNARSTRQLDTETVDAFWNSFVADFRHIFCRVQDARTVNFTEYSKIVEEFEKYRFQFFSKAERNAAMHLNVPPATEKAHFGDLAYLRRIYLTRASGYSRSDSSLEARLASGTKVLAALLDVGVIPMGGDLYEQGREALGVCDETVRFKFRDFLSLATKLREAGTVDLRGALQVLKQRNIASPKNVPRHKMIPAILGDLGLFIDCSCTTEELAKIACRADSEWRDDIDSSCKEDMACFIQRVVENARAASRVREEKLGEKLGFDTDQVMQLRMSFAGMASNGLVDAVTLKSFIWQLNSEVVLRDAEIDSLIAQVAHAHQNDGDLFARDVDFDQPHSKACRGGSSPQAMKSRVSVVDVDDSLEDDARVSTACNLIPGQMGFEGFLRLAYLLLA